MALTVSEVGQHRRLLSREGSLWLLWEQGQQEGQGSGRRPVTELWDNAEMQFWSGWLSRTRSKGVSSGYSLRAELME